VALCDHQRVVAQGLAALLGGEPDIEVVGIASTVAELVEMTARCRPAVVVIDHDLPDGSCIDATRRLKEAHPGVHVVLLVGDCDLADLLGALEAGCSSIQTKRGQADELVRAVRDAILGDVVISASLIHQVVPGLTPMLTAVPAPASGPPSARPSSGGAPLTPRELEVLELLADGLSGSAIAERLYLSAHTVRNHVQRSLDKLGAHSRLEAVAMAVQEDLIRRPLPTARMRA
jgi:DNA-binding NarL/FixJ family response regulator